MNNSVNIHTRKLMVNRILQWKKLLLMSFTLERQQYLSQKFWKNQLKCTRSYQMSFLFLDSELILVGAGQLALK